MDPKDLPPDYLARSYLDAASKAGTEATVIYAAEKNGKRVTKVASNRTDGVANARTALMIGDGAIEKAAVALHSFRAAVPEGAVLPEELNCCYVCHLADPWEALEAVDKEGHRELVKLVLGTAMSQPATSDTTPRVIV